MWLLPFGSFQQRGGATWGAVMDDCTGTMGAVMDDCTGTKEQLCGSSPLLEASKGEEPHNCSFVPVQSSETAPHENVTQSDNLAPKRV